MGRVAPFRVTHAVTVGWTVNHGKMLGGAKQSYKVGGLQ